MEYNMDWLQPALSDIRSRLEALKGVWLQYVAGEPKSVVPLPRAGCLAKNKAGELANASLVKLLDAIAPGVHAPARSASAAEPVHGDRDGLRVPAAGERD